MINYYWRMRGIWLLLILILFGCKTDIDRWKIDYPSEVADEVELFIRTAPNDLRVKPVKIVLVDNIESDVDAAGKSDTRNRLIQLDTTTSHYKNSKFALVWHELGHYALNRQHDDQTKTFVLNNGKTPALPVTLMSTYSSLLTDESLKQHSNIKRYYMWEMFE